MMSYLYIVYICIYIYIYIYTLRHIKVLYKCIVKLVLGEVFLVEVHPYMTAFCTFYYCIYTWECCSLYR